MDCGDQVTIPVFVNDRCINVAPAATARAAVAAADPGLGEALGDGRAHLTDGRGIRIDPAATVGAGAIIRVIRTARRPAEGADDHV